MSLDVARLKEAIRSAANTAILQGFEAVWPIGDVPKGELRDGAAAQRTLFTQVFSEGIAEGVAAAVIDEFTNNAEIATDLTSDALSVSSVTNVTAGVASSGPGTGTLDDVGATGTIS